MYTNKKKPAIRPLDNKYLGGPFLVKQKKQRRLFASDSK
jgi:hypothetical protein